MVLETFQVGPLRCNCSLLGDPVTGEAIVIDPGDDISYILERLQSLRLRLRQIIVTHAHIDHIGGAAALKKATGAEALLNQQDLPVLAQLALQADWLGVPLPETVSIDSSADDLKSAGLPTYPLQILHTPGHTPGSICLYLPAQKLLFSGDTLFAGTVGRTDLPGGDMQSLLRSLHHRLLPLPDDTRVIAGHGWETLLGTERETNPFLQDL